MANVAIFVSAVITFFIPFLIVFAVIYKGVVKNRAKGVKMPQRQLHSRPVSKQVYDPATNTSDYPTACQAGYDPVRAKDQLDTLLKAGHLTHEEYRQRLEQLKNYKHC
ncbi:MAG: hypothetical protein IJ508_04700 [Oscillospiraceae bacterium]|nr:hypothetical protein [Oscillospiraceae bacterium]